MKRIKPLIPVIAALIGIIFVIILVSNLPSATTPAEHRPLLPMTNSYAPIQLSPQLEIEGINQITQQIYPQQIPQLGFLTITGNARVTPLLQGNSYRYTAKVLLSGPNGSTVIRSVLDTGSPVTSFPDSVLQGLGFVPLSSTTMAGVGGTINADVYEIPYPSIIQNGEIIPLGVGNIIVLGRYDVTKTPGLIGTNILAPDDFAVNNGVWSLTVPVS